jgi:HlyD family secretion protein
MRKVLTLGIVFAVILAGFLALVWMDVFGGVLKVRAVALKTQSIQTSVSTNGKIEGGKLFEVRAPVSGLCRNILAHAGDKLRPGQQILTIDDPALQADLAAARSELETAQVELRNVRRGPLPEELNQAEAEIVRVNMELENAGKTLQTNAWLLERNAIARGEVEQSRLKVQLLTQALGAATTRKEDIRRRYDDQDMRRATLRVEAAEARLDQLKGRSRDIILRSPLEGALLGFTLKSGAFVNAGDLIGVIADLQNLKARVFVDEPDLGRITAGAPIQIRWDAHPQEMWKGTVRRIPSEVVAYGSRTVAEVLCGIDDPPGFLIPNVNVDVEIAAAKSPDVPSLPREAVFPDGKNFFVWVVREGRAERRVIQTGRSSVTEIEVTGGISRSDTIIIPGEVPVTAGAKVQVIDK